MHFSLPPNYYDYLKKQCSSIFPYVEKELTNLKEKGLTGPFYNIDEYSAYGQDYLKSEIDIYSEQLFSMFIDRYGEQQARILLAEFHKSEEMTKTLHSFETNYTTAVNFELFAKKTFYITPHLYEHLAHTSIDTDCALARLPFPNCLFVYDSPQALDLLYQIGGHVPSTYKGAVSVFASEVLEKNERKLLLSVFHADMGQVYISVKRQLLLRENWTLERALRTDWLKLSPEEDNETPFTISDETFYTAGLHFIRSIVNTILYLGSNDPDLLEQLSTFRQLQIRLEIVKSIVKRKNIKREMKKTSRLDYIIVGRSVPKLMPDNMDALSDNTKRELHVRFVVRGHWRNQPYGHGNSLRRPLWIKPYYKGPEISELIKNRPYIVS